MGHVSDAASAVYERDGNWRAASDRAFLALGNQGNAFEPPRIEFRFPVPIVVQQQQLQPSLGIGTPSINVPTLALPQTPIVPNGDEDSTD